ncbi:MAG TPA: 2-oxo-hepta-3-ene-1,7-dioic acid hydratase [Micromonospora sp.]
MSRLLDEATVKELARRLQEAEDTRRPMTQLSQLYPDMTIEDAYAIQLAWRDLKIASGRKLCGRKIGLTSRPMQKAQGVDEPDRGVYFDDMIFEDGSVIPMSRFIQPRVEVELAFILARPLSGPGVTIRDVLDATAWIQPALEILDSRLEMKDPKTGAIRKIVDAIGDNAANAGMVLGGCPVRPADVDLRWVSALLYINGVIEETGVSAAVLNHPANSVAWLANSLAPYGERLEPDQPILSGSFTRPCFIHQGDVLQADYGRLGVVTCRFE